MGVPTMTMRPTRNPTDASGVVATADAPDGASPPGNTWEAQNNATITGIFPVEHACLFQGLLACLFQRLWYAALMGRQCGRVVDPQS